MGLITRPMQMLGAFIEGLPLLWAQPLHLLGALGIMGHIQCNPIILELQQGILRFITATWIAGKILSNFRNIHLSLKNWKIFARIHMEYFCLGIFAIPRVYLFRKCGSQVTHNPRQFFVFHRFFDNINEIDINHDKKSISKLIANTFTLQRNGRFVAQSVKKFWNCRVFFNNGDDFEKLSFFMDSNL